MADVEEIIDFIKSLKRGFDKDLFQQKINDLGCTVDTTGLEYDDFHTLFKVWLNISIPISKWVSLGLCLVPPDMVEERTVSYAFRWILANMENSTNVPRLKFLVDWLTAAMECESVDMAALDTGYEIFFTLLSYPALAGHAVKLVYTLTKPADVTRHRVLELIEYSKQRDGQKAMYRHLQVLLGLFKSYKPVCVPEDIPAISVHTAFKKLNVTLLMRFKRNQEQRNKLSRQTNNLMWTNPVNSESGINKRSGADPLIPNLAYNLYWSQKELKTILDFSEPAPLLRYSMHHCMCAPARIRALLCNDTGMTMMAVTDHKQQELLSRDLYHLLTACFLDGLQYSYKEKQDLLHRIAVLQRTVLQGIPVVTRFLAQYLPLWNEMDYFPQILELVEWVNPYCVEFVRSIIDSLSKVYHRSQPIQQCLIIKSLTAMYCNLIYAKTKTWHFHDTMPSENSYEKILPEIAAKISDMCNKQLQAYPDDLRVLYSSIWSAERRSTSELGARIPLGALPGILTLALPLVSISAVLIDKMAALMIMYNKILSSHKNEEPMKILSAYFYDVLNCLYNEEALSGRRNGVIFNTVHPQVVSKLGSLIPDVDSQFSLRNHLAFAPYAYLNLSTVDHKDADNRMLFSTVIDEEFVNLHKFLKKAVPELR